MKFDAGHKKVGGKQKGTLNHTTRDIKEAYKQLIERNLDNLTGWLEIIAEKDPKKAIRILSDLSEYVVPKLARTDVTSGDKPLKSILNITVSSEVSKQAIEKLSADD